MYDALLRSIFNSNSPLDISNLTKKITIDEIQVDNPHIYLNIYMLKANSEVIPMSSEYEYRPDLVSYEKYGSINYWYILLLVNNVPIEDFNKRNLPKILVPKKHVISQVVNTTRLEVKK